MGQETAVEILKRREVASGRNNKLLSNGTFWTQASVDDGRDDFHCPLRHILPQYLYINLIFSTPLNRDPYSVAPSQACGCRKIRVRARAIACEMLD